MADPRTGLAWTVCLALAALAITIRLIYGPAIVDDGYITLRYAANIASGYGFVYNPGENVLGTSTPLFALMLAGAARAGLDIGLTAVALGIVADAAAVVLIFHLAWQGRHWYPALVSALGYCLYRLLAFYAVSGMETPLYAMMALGACLAYARRRYAAAGAIAGLVAVLRPEGVILAAALAVCHIWRRRPVTAPPLLSFLAITAPWVVFSLFYFGSPVPNSMLAKLQYGTNDPFTSVGNLATYFLRPEEHWFLPVTVLGIVGLRRCWRAGAGHQVLLTWGAVYTLAFTVANKFLYPSYPFEWYFVPVLVPLALSAGYGLESVCRLIAGKLPVRRSHVAAAGLAVFGGFYLLVDYQGYDLLRMIIGGREGLYREVASRLDRYQVKEVIAAPEIGTVGFYHSAPVLDIEGLVSPQTIGKSYKSIVEEYRPPWLVSWNTLVPEGLLSEPWFDREYRPVFVRTNWEGRQAVIYRRYPTDAPAGSRGLRLGDIAELKHMQIATSTLHGRTLLHVRLDWDVLRPAGRPYTFFVHLQDSSGRLLAQQDNEPQEGTRHTNALPTGHLADLYDLEVPAGADLRDARIAIGAYSVQDHNERLLWTTRGGTSLGMEALLPLNSGQDEEADHQGALNVCKVDFDGSIALLGYSLDSTQEGALRLSLFWKGIRPVSQDYSIFVHMLDRHGGIASQVDGQPGNGRYPTSVWIPGETVLDQREFPRAPGAPPVFRVGLYLLAEGQRLPVQSPGPGDGVTVDVSSLSCVPSAS